MVTFAYPYILVSIPICIGLYLMRAYAYRLRYYFFPAARLLETDQKTHVLSPHVMRLITIILLLLALARPRTELQRIYHQVQGIDMELVLDVSGSMQLFDDLATQKSRWSSAQQEAINFVSQRAFDSIGLILFGAYAVSRCPITHDKKMLTECISSSQLGEVNPEGTLLVGALLLAGNKLLHCTGSSKVIIILTDGAPSAHDSDPSEALEFLKREHIKVYTIGIGGEEGGYIQHPLFGIMNVQSPLNATLLQNIAQETGGAFFRATNQSELAQIYQKIDELERSDHAVPQTVVYHEYFIYLLWLAALSCALEFVLIGWLRWL